MIEKIEMNFNYGLGFLPVSQFIKLSSIEGNLTTGQIMSLFGELSEHRDVIFYGDILEQNDNLQFLSLLLSHYGFMVSNVIDYDLLVTHSILVEKLIGFIILYVNTAKNLQMMLQRVAKHLRQGDKIIFNLSDVKALQQLSLMVDQLQIKAKVMFLYNTKEFLEAVLENKIYNLIPINNKNFPW